jgi:hypothetical protein
MKVLAVLTLMPEASLGTIPAELAGELGGSRNDHSAGGWRAAEG